MVKTINLVTASSDEYVPFLCVLLRSILDHVSDDYLYFIYIISDCISLPHKTKIKKMIRRKSNVSIQFVDDVRYLSNPALYTRGRISRTTYSKLAILELPDNIDKIVYLDADVVVNVDPSYLFNIDLKSYYLAAVRDPMMTSWCIGEHKASELENLANLNIKDCKEYFNAGVLLIDLKLWRTLYSSDYFFKVATSRKWLWLDQDILNKEFHNRVLYLNQSWNFMTCTEDMHRPLIFDLLEYPYKEKNAPKIVHYAGHTIPCFRPRVIKGSYFWRYAFRTPFASTIIKNLFIHLLHKTIPIADNYH